MPTPERDVECKKSTGAAAYAAGDNTNGAVDTSDAGRARGMSRMEQAMSRVAQEHANYVAERRHQERLQPSSLSQPRRAWVEAGREVEYGSDARTSDLPKSTVSDGPMTSYISTPTTVHATPVVVGHVRLHPQTASDPQNFVQQSGWHHVAPADRTPPPTENADDRDERGLPDAYLTIYSKLQAAKAMEPSPQRKQLLQALYNMGSVLLKAQVIPVTAVPSPAETAAQQHGQQPNDEGDEQHATTEGGKRGHARRELAPCVATGMIAGAAAQSTPVIDWVDLVPTPQSRSNALSDQMPSVTAAMALLGARH